MNRNYPCVRKNMKGTDKGLALKAGAQSVREDGRICD